MRLLYLKRFFSLIFPLFLLAVPAIALAEIYPEQTDYLVVKAQAKPRLVTKINSSGRPTTKVLVDLTMVVANTGRDVIVLGTKGTPPICDGNTRYISDGVFANYRIATTNGKEITAGTLEFIDSGMDIIPLQEKPMPTFMPMPNLQIPAHGEIALARATVELNRFKGPYVAYLYFSNSEIFSCWPYMYSGVGSVIIEPL